MKQEAQIPKRKKHLVFGAFGIIIFFVGVIVAILPTKLSIPERLLAVVGCASLIIADIVILRLSVRQAMRDREEG